MGFFYEEMMDSSANKVAISGTNLPKTIEGVVEHDISFEGSAQWGQVTSLISDTIDKAGELVQAVTNTNYSTKNQYNTRAKWDGSSAIRVSLTMTFMEFSEQNKDGRSKTKSQEVADIFSMLYPSTEQNKTTLTSSSVDKVAAYFKAQVLTTPQGYNPYNGTGLLSLRIGKWFYASNYWILDSVSPVMSKATSRLRNVPVINKVNLVLSTYQTPLSSEVRSWFLGGANVTEDKT